MTETERHLYNMELSAAIKKAWKAGLEVEDVKPEMNALRMVEPRVFMQCPFTNEWQATLLSLFIRDGKYTRFYTFIAKLPAFVKVA